MSTKKMKKNDRSKKIIIDLTKITQVTDPYKCVALAKFNTMSDVEMNIIRDYAVNAYFAQVADEINSAMADYMADLENNKIQLENSCEKCICKKKPNIFKRFWNWVTRKK